MGFGVISITEQINVSRLTLQRNSPFPNYASVPANNNLKSRLVLSCARKYSKCMKTWHKSSTSGYCSRELKRNSEMGFSLK